MSRGQLSLQVYSIALYVLWNKLWYTLNDQWYVVKSLQSKLISYIVKNVLDLDRQYQYHGRPKRNQTLTIMAQKLAHTAAFTQKW